MELKADGYSSGNCLDFDQACATFWRMVTNAREERVKGPITKEHKLGDKQTWHPKYKNDEELLSRLYYADGPRITLDPVIHGMSDTELDAIMETWDPYAEPEA